MTQTSATILPREAHCVSRSEISTNALKVLNRLAEAGFQSFLVGGGVRDLLLGRRPKDFDIATDARPEQVRELFRNCRLIGRRFRLAHIHFGRDIIEVATFRSEAGAQVDEVTDSGRILRDNTYGDIESDVWRRDFTVNALYYDSQAKSIWDYVGGVDDVQSRILRLIGDPAVRYTEDPVRMLRAARFSAKLEFSVDDKALSAIPGCVHLLSEVPAARKYEEVLKLFLSGHARRSLEQLSHMGLLGAVFPVTDSLLSDASETEREFLLDSMTNTDRRVADQKSVTPFFLFGTLLWPVIERATRRLESDKGMRPSYALQVATSRVVQQQQQATAIPRRVIAPMREMIALQARLVLPQGKRSWALLRHPRFRAAYDLLVLRGASGLLQSEWLDWWTRLQECDESQQGEMIRKAEREGPKKRRRRRRRRRRRGGTQQTNVESP
ncbi:MAG: polynucleotide adenylyltransferase PcnB [Pseudomonadota bacterium]